MKPLAHHYDYIQIEKIILEPAERSQQIPEETRCVPFKVFVNGWLVNDEAAIGDEVTILTRIGRSLTGRLYQINPEYTHSFGPQIQELIQLDFNDQARNAHE